MDGGKNKKRRIMENYKYKRIKEINKDYLKSIKFKRLQIQKSIKEIMENK